MVSVLVALQTLLYIYLAVGGNFRRIIQEIIAGQYF